MKAKKVRIMLLGLRNKHVSELESRFPEISFCSPNNNEAIKYADEVDAIVGLYGRSQFNEVLTEDFMSRAANLKWLNIPGAGIETVLTPQLVDHPCKITNGKILQGPEVADHAMALLLTLTRNIQLVLRKADDVRNPRPLELMNKTAVVVGAGGIGMLIAERAFSFGMAVNVINVENVPYIRSIEKLYAPNQFCDILPEADVLFIAAPLTSMTKEILGDSELSIMKENSIIINVSRGGLVDTEALTKHLSKGKFHSVGLDVTNPEPLPGNHKLLNFSNVVVTPHLAGMSDKNHDRVFENLLQNINNFLSDNYLINIVDKQKGY